MADSARRFSILVLVVLGALPLAISACGSSGGAKGPAGDIALGLANCEQAEYGGTGKPEALVVSDLPMQGDSAERSKQQVDAIRLVFEKRGWKAGAVPVAYQACDDTIAKTGLWDQATCQANARAYAGNDHVLGVIGTYNSGCAAEIIPILNKAGVAMVSPGNTAVCLTLASKNCVDYSPASLFKSGKRNYLRVVPNDAFQGAALAEFARDHGVKQPFVLFAADDPTSTGQATNFQGAASQVGLTLAGSRTWDPKAASYAGLFEKVKQSGADAVVLAGLTEQNADRVIRDKVAVLGPNDQVPLIGFDGLAQQSTIDQAGSAAEGMFAGVPGRAPEQLTGEGRSLVQALAAETKGKPVELYAPYAAEGAAVVLDAIAKAGTSRPGVIQALFATRRKNGILGTYRFERSGDPSVGPVTIFEARKKFERSSEITPDAVAVRAAVG